MPARLLLIEDNPGDARLIVEMLKEGDGQEFTVDCATTLATGLEKLGSNLADIVLLDLSLPDSHGFDTYLRFQAKFPHLPVVILTGLNDEQTAVKAARAGAQDYFIKGTITGPALGRALIYAIERKKAQETILLQGTRYAALIATTSDGYWHFDRGGQLLNVNDTYCQMTGYTREELLQMNVNQFEGGQDKDSLLAHRQEIEADGFDRFETRHRKKNGETFDVEISVSFLEATGDLLSFARDITRRKQAEAERARAEEKYRTIFEDAVIGIFQITPEGRPVSVNRAFARMHGYDSPERFMTEVQNVYPLFADGDASQKLAPLLNNERAVHSVELKILGNNKWVSTNIRPVSDTYGKVVLYEGTVEDITARKEAGAIQEELSRIIATVPGIVYSFLMRPDGSSAIPFASPGLRNILDVDPDAVTHNAAPLWEAIHPDDLSHVKAAFADSFRSLTPWHEEFRVNRPKNGLVWVKGDALPERQPDGSVLWHGFLIDNTERKQLESQLLQAQKMEAVGRLTGGVSHDLNNIMGIVIGYSDLVTESLSSSDLNLPRMIKIKDAAHRASALVRQLLAFSRLQVFAPTLMNLNVSITHLSEMLPPLLGKDIQLTLALDQDLWSVKADPSQVDQVLINLAVNARDAMPNGGNLVIEAHNVDLEASCAALPPDVPPGAFAMICFSDTGVGISPEVMPHIFEPFFTTKEMGRGTGLGLSTVYGIVRQSGGFISVETRVPQGTIFKVFLPGKRERTRIAPQEKGCTRPATVASKRILLAEDDAALREIVSIQLEELGYIVLAASDGGEALRMAEKETGPIDLLLTDVVMPGMNGRQLADRLKQRIPVLKVLFVSGYSGDVISREGGLEPGAYFAQKPLTKIALDEKLRSIFSS